MYVRDIIKNKRLDAEIIQIRTRIYHSKLNENSNNANEIGNKCIEPSARSVQRS